MSPLFLTEIYLLDNIRTIRFIDQALFLLDLVFERLAIEKVPVLLYQSVGVSFHIFRQLSSSKLLHGSARDEQNNGRCQRGF